MQVLHDRCAGLDVHKKTVVCCVWITSPNGHATHETRTFSTMVEAGPDRPRSMIKGIYHMLARGTPWIELGADYFERRNPLKIVSRLTHRLHRLGFEVALSFLGIGTQSRSGRSMKK